MDEFSDESHKKEEDQRINPKALLSLLDGQECRLDAKYERTFLQRVNVPIMIMGKTLPRSFRDPDTPFAKGIIPLKFADYALQTRMIGLFMKYVCVIDRKDR